MTGGDPARVTPRSPFRVPRLKSGCSGWSRTSTGPLNRREDYCYPTEQMKWSEWQDFHLRPPGPKPGALKTELHSEKNGGPEGSCTLVAVR